MIVWCNIFICLMPIILLTGFVLMFVDSKQRKKRLTTNK